MKPKKYLSGGNLDTTLYHYVFSALATIDEHIDVVANAIDLSHRLECMVTPDTAFPPLTKQSRGDIRVLKDFRSEHNSHTLV